MKHIFVKYLFCVYYIFQTTYPVSGQNLQYQQGQQAKAVLSPLLMEYLLQKKDDDPFQVLVEPKDAAALTDYLRLNMPGMVKRKLSGNFSFFELHPVSKKQLLELVNSGVIVAAELCRTPHPERALNGLDLTLNQVNLLRRHIPQINGGGRGLSIKENSFDTSDIDFRGRILSSPLSANLKDQHATNMATIAAGGGNSDPTGMGVAPGAWLSSSSFEVLLPDPQDYFTQNELFVQNHSYGTGIENYYGIETVAYDQFCQALPNVLHVFSAGNDGDKSSTLGTYANLAGFANLTGQFKQSKNTLSVGALDSLGNVVLLSSTGPAYDGRLKPELVAYGLGGSSGAAALVSGMALLVQQVFIEKYGELPPSSLVKAILINSARDTGSPYPDFKSGFGMADAYQAVQTVQENRITTGIVEQNAVEIRQITVPPGVSQLKITLAWNDPPAPLNAPVALVNDLDLECLHPASAQTWLPWTLSVFPQSDSLSRIALRGRDSLNNVEQITILTPSPGEYQIRIIGRRVGQAGQPFALAWQLDTSGVFRWCFPTASDYVLPVEKTILRWENSFSGGGEGILQFRYTDSSDWDTVETQINASRQHAFWTPPGRQGLAQVRWVSNEGIFPSDTFIVAEPLWPKVGFDCPDSLMFFWNPIQEADFYKVFHLKNRYLETLATTNDTMFVRDAEGKKVLVYAVAPVFSGKTGPLSHGFNYTWQQVDCYLKSFYLQSVANTTATFTANVGAIYGLQSIQLERLIAGVFQPVLVIEPVEETSLTLEDGSMEQGVNFFRLKIVLKNGSVIYSQVEKAYCVKQGEFLLFPNPVPAGETIVLLSRVEQEVVLKLFDVQGSLIFKEDFSGTYSDLPVEGLLPGIYFLCIQDNSGLPIQYLRLLVVSRG